MYAFYVYLSLSISLSPSLSLSPSPLSLSHSLLLPLPFFPSPASLPPLRLGSCVIWIHLNVYWGRFSSHMCMTFCLYSFCCCCCFYFKSQNQRLLKTIIFDAVKWKIFCLSLETESICECGLFVSVCFICRSSLLSRWTSTFTAKTYLNAFNGSTNSIVHINSWCHQLFV